MKNIAALLIFCFIQQINCLQHFVLIASPGSGKGTLSQHLIQKYGYVQICPGDIYRNEIRQQTELGKRIQPIVDSGEYVDEETTCALIYKYLLQSLDQNKFFIIDGFPRTAQSFLFLHDIFKRHHLSDQVCFIQLVAPDECCIARVCDRQICTGCFKVYNAKFAKSCDSCTCDDCGTALTKRVADTKEIMIKRLSFFHSQIEPIIQMAAQIYDTKVIDTDCCIESLIAIYDDLIKK